LKGKYLKGKIIEYDGSQLSPLWAYINADVQGDSIVFFRGPCSISEEYMVDIDDRKKNSIISSPEMLHFIVEQFGCGIDRIVLIGRLLVSVVIETLRYSTFDDVEFEREFDNIFGYLPDEGDRGKLSVSVATVSPVSGLIHLGLNIKSKGTPVRTVGLDELGVEDVDKFAVEVARRFIEEMKALGVDASKVRPVSDSCF